VRSEIFSQASAPSLAIPDNDPGGRSDTLIFEEQAVVDWIKVGVDLEHPWKGDLRLTLIAPSGDFVVLQDRVGAGADNIRRTFDPTETPALARLAGQPLAGDWTLHVQDLASRDTGVLKSWALDIQGRVDVAVELEDLAGVTIPDNDPRGLERTLSTALEGHVRNLRVAVDITHTFVRDLTVTLVSPLGTEVVLHNREGGSNDNVIRTFTVSDTPTLLAVRGEEFHGEWKLRVTDQEGRDVGKLNRWGLRIERLARAPAEVELAPEPVHC
jgi:subtilisin-like proprotein convertase family protein